MSRVRVPPGSGPSASDGESVGVGGAEAPALVEPGPMPHEIGSIMQVQTCEVGSRFQVQTSTESSVQHGVSEG